MTEFSMKDELAKEFGGVWEPVLGTKHANTEFRAVFEDIDYASALGQWLKRYNVPHTFDIDTNDILDVAGKGIAITLLHPSGTLECADMFCGKFHNPENAHVTVQSVLNRINPEKGASRDKSS